MTTQSDSALVEDDFAPIWDEGTLLAEHEAVRASVELGGWMSAALDDPNVCDAMKADINRWFSAGFLYLDKVREIIHRERIAAGERVRDAAIDKLYIVENDADRMDTRANIRAMNIPAIVGGGETKPDKQLRSIAADRLVYAASEYFCNRKNNLELIDAIVELATRAALTKRGLEVREVEQ